MMIKSLAVILGSLAVVFSSAPTPVDDLDVSAYMGSWYQIGDYPQFYERSCNFCTKANYNLNSDGTIGVLNSCRASVTGKLTNIKATATVPDKSEPGKLKVKFFGLFGAPYWIIKLGPVTTGQYDYAVVSDGTRKSLYVLARKPALDDSTMQSIQKFLEAEKFDMSKFSLTTQMGCPVSSDEKAVEMSDQVLKLTQPSFVNTAANTVSPKSPNGACPGSHASLTHAKCQMTVKLDSPCDAVKAEILARVNGTNGWYDPHNRGIYSVVDASTNLVQLKRQTGDKKYTDLLNFELSSSGSGCIAVGCSESQVFSVIDYSTNYCNLHDLYCGSKAGCKFVTTDINISGEAFTSCSQHDASKCLAV